MINQDNVFSVSEINLHIKHVMESNMTSLFIEGEIANYTHHNSGHIYFSLKDANATIRCVFFRTYNKYMDFRPKNGDKVICGGKITVYERGGNYQIMVSKIILSGKGELQFLFEQTKEKLSEEGLFDEIHKQTIPTFPQTIGVITSETGAAIEDIKTVLNRRFPVHVFLYPAIVQGKDAPKKIRRGIHYFNEKNMVDLIILGRGGGSQEDLFCFNDEALARDIFASTIPIISAVGHEIDFTISDFVADLRAPTPSAAAELAVPDRIEYMQYIDQLSEKMTAIIRNKLEHKAHILKQKKLELSLHHPTEKIKKWNQQCLLFEQKLSILPQQIREIKTAFLHKKKQFHHAFETASFQTLEQQKNKLRDKTQKLESLFQMKLEEKQNKFAMLQQKCIELSPQKALERGYSILRKEKKIIRSIHNLASEDYISLLLQDGEITCQIKDIKKISNNTKSNNLRMSEDA